MKLSFLFFGNHPDEQWQLARQMGIGYAIAKLAPELTGELPPWDLNSLENSKRIYEAAGFKLYGLEGDQFDMNRIKLGLEGRDEDIVRYQQMLRNMGKLGMPLLCYNFMAGLGWYRTSTDVEERGGALVTAFDAAIAEEQGLTEFGEVAEETIWENYRYFIQEVIPVAEEAGVKMALHPDDPPHSPLRGIGRIFTRADGVRRALSLTNSTSHGITFCQGTYTTMGEDVKALAEEFGSGNRIHFVHIRDVEGNASCFRETFHDNGPTDMVSMFKAYKNIDFQGAIRSDHVPTMAGESNARHGYAMKGNLFGLGYMKGIMEALEIDIE
jgi:mannonate dehydratase